MLDRSCFPQAPAVGIACLYPLGSCGKFFRQHQAYAVVALLPSLTPKQTDLRRIGPALNAGCS